MSRLEQDVRVSIPLAQAAARLRTLFDAHRDASGHTATIDIFVNADIRYLPSPLRFHRSIVSTIRPRLIDSCAPMRYLVHWTPERHGCFSLFSGEIS